jgi:SAM-dependent methyltransferase
VSAAAETHAIKLRYQRRVMTGSHNRYSLLDDYALLADQEKDRALVRMLRSSGMAERVAERRLLEIGCGSGGNLLRFIQLGFRPENIVGNELLADRLCTARSVLPPSVRLFPGDASQLESSEQSFDIVCVFTVFSSILDDAFQDRLAAKAWTLVKPGGGVLWYDFIYNNPANPDVRGVSLRRVRQLFPEATFNIRRVTLAPPLGRSVTSWWNGCYTFLNSMPFLRSHILMWAAKRK